MGAPNPDVTALVNQLALQYWTVANRPDLSGVVAAVTAQLSRLGGEINSAVIAFAQTQVTAVFTAEEALEQAHGGPPASGGTASALTATATLATGAVSGAISTLATSAASYGRTSAQTVPRNVLTIINFDVLEVDTDSAVTTGAAWVYTVPTGKGGLFVLTANVLILTNSTTNLIFAQFQKNGVELKRVYSDPVISTSNNTPMVGGCTIVPLVPGDTINFRMQVSDSTSDVTTASNVRQVWISIARIPGS
jgi:hypothetical protein